MKIEIRDLEKKREVLNKLAENIEVLDINQKNILQQISEEMDMLIIDYINNSNLSFKR
jgi:hypothetical protein